MEQEHHQWIVHDHEEEQEEDMENGALKKRQSLSHGKGNLVTDVEASSSSSSLTSNGSEHSNGVRSVVTDPDGSPVQKEEEVAEIVNVGENGNHVVDDDKVDYEAVGLGLVAEFVGAATYGEAITGATFSASLSQDKNSVYLDKQQDDEVNGLNGVQNGDASGPVHPKNPGEREFDVQVDHSVNQYSLCSEIVNKCMKIVDDKVPFSSELSHLHNSSDIQATTVTNFHKETSGREDPNLIKEIDQQLEEFDVEAVLEKQDTHDLFCPNCNSCITKRVILKKRKRTIHKLSSKAKRDKLETVVSSELVDSSAQPETNQVDHANVTSDIVSQESPADNSHPDGQPEVFRCLSCFSFFIPSGKCFDLLRNFGGTSKNERSENSSSIPASNLQNTSNPPGSNEKWLSFLFPPNKGKKTSDASLEHSRTGPAERHHSKPTTSNVITSHPEGPLADTSDIKNAKPMPDINHGRGGINSLISTTNDVSSTQACTKSADDLMNEVQRVEQDSMDFSTKEQLLAGNLMSDEGEKKNALADIRKTDNAEDMSSINFSDANLSKHDSVQFAAAATTETLVNTGETAKDAILDSYEEEPEFPVSTTVGSTILEMILDDIDKIPETVKNSFSLGHGAQAPNQSFGNVVVANDVASKANNSEIDAIVPSKIGFTVIDKVQKDSDKGINPSTGKENEGGDVIVVVDRDAFESLTSQRAHNIPVEGANVTESHSQAQIGGEPGDEVGEPQGWEVLKSIVYGGLIESITSLGVVSSAVSSGATPLNIIALGFANIIGGLLILGNNLIDLKNDNSGDDQQQMSVQDRYQELLGRRANFMLHAVVAVLSFLLFGSLPLVIYGLLINKSYHNEVKLAAVVATSLACIILLAMGKVYTSRPPKSYVKTILYYVTLALSASGVSYIGGNLIKDLLEKYNYSKSGFAITMPISDASMESRWTSY